MLNKVVEIFVAFLALVGVSTLVFRKKTVTPEESKKEVDEIKSKIAEEVNETSTSDLVADYNKRHGKG